MPLIRVPHDPYGGARVRLRVGLSRAQVVALRMAQQPVPPPIEVDALLDSGAEVTCLDPAVIARAGLTRNSSVLVVAPGTGVMPVPGLGGAGVGGRYEAGLAVLHPSGKAPDHLTIPTLDVTDLPLAGLGYEALIGRDILAQCVLVYDGPAGAATLAY